MPLESFEEEGLAKIPNLELAQMKFLLKTEKFKDDPKIKRDLLEAIKADSKFRPAQLKVKTPSDNVNIIKVRLGKRGTKFKILLKCVNQLWANFIVYHMVKCKFIWRSSGIYVLFTWAIMIVFQSLFAFYRNPRNEKKWWRFTIRSQTKCG